MKYNHEKDAVIHQLRHQEAPLSFVKVITFKMVTSAIENQQIAVTLFVSALRQSGLDVTELGIDPHQLQTYFTSVERKYKGNCSVSCASTNPIYVAGIGNIYRPAGVIARSQGPDILCRVPVRVAACLSILRERGGIGSK